MARVVHSTNNIWDPNANVLYMAPKSDQAMNKNPGGIDFNPASFALGVTKSGQGVVMPLMPKEILAKCGWAGTIYYSNTRIKRFASVK